MCLTRLSRWHPATDVACSIGKCESLSVPGCPDCVPELRVPAGVAQHALSAQCLQFVSLPAGGKRAHGPRLPAGLQGRPALLGCHGLHRLLCPRPQGHPQHAQRQHRGMCLHPTVLTHRGTAASRVLLLGAHCIAAVHKQLQVAFIAAHLICMYLLLSTEDMGSFYGITDQNRHESNRSKKGWE